MRDTERKEVKMLRDTPRDKPSPRLSQDLGPAPDPGRRLDLARAGGWFTFLNSSKY